MASNSPLQYPCMDEYRRNMLRVPHGIKMNCSAVQVATRAMEVIFLVYKKNGTG